MRIPRAAWVCAFVAFANGVAWGLIVPPFQLPDEPGHVAYVQYLAETGKPPPGERSLEALSVEERRVLRALRYKQVEFRPDNRPLTTARAQRMLEEALESGADRVGEGGYTHASGLPPLYYALAAAAYHATPSTNLLDRLHVMRLVAALLAAVTALLVFLFCAQLLPATPWAWTVGGLVAAMQPVFGNLSGAVHSDSLLYAAAAGVFLAFAISFRRGLTVGSGAAIGAALAVGALAKPTMLGLAPGIALGLLLLVVRAEGTDRRAAVRGAIAAAACAAAPLLLYALLNATVWDYGVYLRGSGDKPRPDAGTTSIGGGLSYIWQFYLPRLPFMDDQFEGYELADVWFDGFVGRFGVLEYGFGTAVDAVALVVYALVIAFAVRELVVCAPAVRRRALELATYVAMALALLFAIHWAGYQGRTLYYTGFEQARYLLPLLALYGGLSRSRPGAPGAASARWPRSLWSRLAVTHTLLALLLTITRYYG